MLASVFAEQQGLSRSFNGTVYGSKRNGKSEKRFMDIFACQPCRKRNKKRSSKRGSSGYRGSGDRNNKVGPSPEDKQTAHQQHQQQHPQLNTTDEEGSLKRPLTCKAAFGRRKSVEKRGDATIVASPVATLRETWRSLPNLRSPTLAVRAMTLKFKALTSNGSHDKERVTPRKRAHFNEDVDVIVHDDAGNEVDTQCVKIKYGDDSSLDYLEPNMARGRQEDLSLDRSPALRDRRNRAPLRLDFLDIKRKGDGQRYIKCVIHIGDDFDRQRISVRSANGGTRLVLVAYRSEPLGDGTYFWRQYTEKFRLPHAIDPNDVNATLHSAGDLVIEAPLFEFEGD